MFFCTQIPTDVPNAVLSQLGARVQHALRAFSPDDQKALSRTVKTYPRTEHYDLEQALTSLGTGEAIITVLSERGTPTPVAWTRLRAPRSLMNTIGDAAITTAAQASPLHATYAETVDRESAYEKLAAKVVPPAAAGPPTEPATPPEDQEREGMFAQVLGNPAVRSLLRSATSSAGPEISRGMFGTRRRR